MECSQHLQCLVAHDEFKSLHGTFRWAVRSLGSAWLQAPTHLVQTQSASEFYTSTAFLLHLSHNYISFLQAFSWTMQGWSCCQEIMRSVPTTHHLAYAQCWWKPVCSNPTIFWLQISWCWCSCAPENQFQSQGTWAVKGQCLPCTFIHTTIWMLPHKTEPNIAWKLYQITNSCCCQELGCLKRQHDCFDSRTC